MVSERDFLKMIFRNMGRVWEYEGYFSFQFPIGPLKCRTPISRRDLKLEAAWMPIFFVVIPATTFVKTSCTCAKSALTCSDRSTLPIIKNYEAILIHANLFWQTLQILWPGLQNKGKVFYMLQLSIFTTMYNCMVSFLTSTAKYVITLFTVQLTLVFSEWSNWVDTISVHMWLRLS